MMTQTQYREALARLGLTQEEAATVLGVKLRAAHGYANGRNIPLTIERLLIVLIETKYPIEKWF